MRAKRLSDLLNKKDRVAVSNITGREASKVSVSSQKYCGNIVAGWALGKGGSVIDVPGGIDIPVFATADEMMQKLPSDKLPNKAIVYSPPAAVYGEVKELVACSGGHIETIFIITEHVSTEVTAKIAHLTSEAGIDCIGCNTLGMINSFAHVRVGAVGGDRPDESFKPGGAAIISNSGNMVNTMASYLQSAGIGTAFGLSTGKDALIMTPTKELLELAAAETKVKMVVLYIEPGGLYEKEAVEMLQSKTYPKPIIAYITGEMLSKYDLSLGHAGAVVDGEGTTATAKMKMFDEYFGREPFKPGRRAKKEPKKAPTNKRGIRISSLHHLAGAAAYLSDTLKIQRDFKPTKKLALNPWFANLGKFGAKLPSNLVLPKGYIPEPYHSQAKTLMKDILGSHPPKRNMRSSSHASANDGKLTRIYDSSIEDEMTAGSFARTLIRSWMGRLPENEFEIGLIEKCLIASVTNGPGTISAQGAKLSTSAGNAPNTAMIATLACMGDIHGGNGRRAVEYLIGIFRQTELRDAYSPRDIDIEAVAQKEAERFAKERASAKEAGTDYRRIPCLGHPVFNKDPVNYDPRERVVYKYLQEIKKENVFLEFYHLVTQKLKDMGIARNVWAVNLDGAIASSVLGMCWGALIEKQISISRVCDIAFLVFAIGRAAGGASEYLDHSDFGSPMDMRIPVSECVSLTRPANGSSS